MTRSPPAGRDPAFLAKERTARTTVQILSPSTLSISPNCPYPETQLPAVQIPSSRASVAGRREKKKNERDGSRGEREREREREERFVLNEENEKKKKKI